MNAAELDIIVHGITDLAVTGALWSLLFFGRVKVSSPAAARTRQAPKPGAGAEAVPEPAVKPAREAA